MPQFEGSLWRAASLLAAAGQLRTALLMLRAAGLADAALGFSAICREAGFGAAPETTPLDSAETAGTGDVAADTRELEDLYPHGNGSGGPARRPATGFPGGAAGSSVGHHVSWEDAATEGDHQQYVVRILQAL